MKTILLALLFASTAVFSQELLPELKPLADKFANDRNNLVGAPWEKGYAAILQPYSAALNDLEKSATAKGDLQTVAAIQKEREALGDGNPVPIVPPALRSLEGIRSKFIHDLARLNAERGKNTNAVDAEYLRNLLALSAKFPANAALQKQIAEEKKRVLSGNFTPTSTTTEKASSIKNIFPLPLGGEGWDKGKAQATEVEEGSLKFMRVTGDKMSQTITLPAGKSARLTFKIRAIEALPSRGFGIIQFFYRDDSGKDHALLSTANPESTTKYWKIVDLNAALPAGITSFRINIVGLGEKSFDIRDIVLSVK